VKVFYHCYGSSHTSVVAAAIHVGRLASDRLPSLGEIQDVPHFDRIRAAELGTVFVSGRGPDGEEVLVVGFGPGRKIVREAVLSLLELKGAPPKDYLLVDALDGANGVVRIGGMLSRRLGLVSVGRPLAALGIRLMYRRLVRLAEKTRAEVKRRQGLP
jgi:hypothetical protein